jgi:hypothetical protein
MVEYIKKTVDYGVPGVLTGGMLSVLSIISAPFLIRPLQAISAQQKRAAKSSCPFI